MISPIKNKKEQNVRNQKEKLPLLSNPDGSAMGFFPGLCQVRSLLENKLVEVQFKVKRDHGWKQLFAFLFFKDGAGGGWICEAGIDLGFFNFGELLPPLPI